MLKTKEKKTEGENPYIKRDDPDYLKRLSAYKNKMFRPQNKMQVIYTNKVMR